MQKIAHKLIFKVISTIDIEIDMSIFCMCYTYIVATIDDHMMG